MSDRRHTTKPVLDPLAVMALDPSHPAMKENRTLFPSTVVTVTNDEPDRLLVSGHNNRKIGSKVEKGKFKGYSIFMLSLEERATCPEDCGVRAICYGNSMHMARRHRIGDSDTFFDRLGLEIVQLLDDHEGLLIRLHVLGDFPSVEYVSFWKEVLDEYENVACFGYTHRRTVAWDGDEIGDALDAVKQEHPDRFRIRWSSDVPRPDGAIVLDSVPKGSRADNGALLCPSQVDATACCATCALCWETAAAKECIGFVKHGPKSDQNHADAISSGTAGEASSASRRIKPLDLPAVKPQIVPAGAPELRLVKPTDLAVEASYQRDLSGKSIGLIKKIVANFDWAKFKPPICAESGDGLFVIDGQHTAIAAATHPHVYEIPVMVVKRDMIERRADAFVSQNTERVAVSPLQVFHAEITSNKPDVIAILKAATKAGGTIPRTMPQKGRSKPGQITAVSAARRILRTDGVGKLERILRIAVLSKVHPINSTLLYGLQYIVRGGHFSETAALEDQAIAAAIARIEKTPGAFDKAAQAFASDSDMNRYRAAAILIATETEEILDATG